MKPSKPDTLYTKPFLWMLWSRIKTLFGYINIEYIKSQYPAAQHAINENISFRERTAEVLLKRVDLFFMQIESRGHEKVIELYNENNMAWKKYAANVNRLSRTNKLLPEAFSNMVREKLPYYLKAIVFESKKAKPGDAAHKLQPGRVE